MTIAGHTFGPDGRCSCSVRFADIAGAQREHIGKPHWAHSGMLTESELDQIQTEVRRIWDLLVGSATGNGPSTRQEDDMAAAEMA